MFISRDPIGLMGGSNVFQYAPNPTGWIDPFGLSRNNKKYKQQIQEIEINTNDPNVHGLRRHGAGTTIEQQQYRAKTGFTPDGKQGKPQDSSRFLTQKDQFDSMNKALELKASDPSRTSFTFEMDRPVAEGYLKGGKGNKVTTNVVTANFNKKTNKLYTIFGSLKNGGNCV